MRRLIRAVLLIVLLAPIAFVALRITVLNPAWQIRWRFPDAELRLQTVNSPDLHLWSAVAGLFGIPMTDPDHSLTVTIRDRTAAIDFAPLAVGADELYLQHCRVTDISQLLRGLRRLSGVTFSDCDLTQLPAEQRLHIRPQINRGSDVFYIPYESLRGAPLAQLHSQK